MMTENCYVGTKLDVTSKVLYFSSEKLNYPLIIFFKHGQVLMLWNKTTNLKTAIFKSCLLNNKKINNAIV